MAGKRGNSWQGRLKTPEKYYRFSFPSRSLAEDWEATARAALKAGRPIPEPGADVQSRPTLSQFYATHRDVIWRDKLPRNVEANQRACVAMLGEDMELPRIDDRELARMVSKMIRAGNKPGTINTRLSHLRVLLRYAKSLHIVEVVPEFPWQAVGDNARLRFLTEEEEAKLIALLDHWGLPHVARLVGVLIDTGCRPGELIRGETRGAPIKWSEVSVSAGGEAPDVNDPKTGKAKAVISLFRTKTGRPRVLPLTERAREAFLQSREAGEDRPFGSMRADDFSAHIRKAADHLGYHDVVAYTFRHTCASRLVQRGADLGRVRQWMGHTSIKTTLRYAKLTPTDIFELEGLL